MRKIFVGIVLAITLVACGNQSAAAQPDCSAQASYGSCVPGGR